MNKKIMGIVGLIMIIMVTVAGVPALDDESAIPCDGAQLYDEYEVTGSVTWEDEDDDDGLRPYAVEITLLKDGEALETAKATAADYYTFAFSGLKGSKDRYSVTMEDISGYEVSTSKTSGDQPDVLICDIKAVHSHVAAVICGTIIFDDDNDRDGLRPNTIPVTLLANEEPIAAQDVPAKRECSFSFSGLEQASQGRAIQYKIQVPDYDGYGKTYDGFSAVYRHEAALTSISGTIIFDDQNNQDGIRPRDVKICLKDEDEIIDTVNVTESNDWQYEFNDVPKNKAGKPVKYQIDAIPTSGYDIIHTEGGFTMHHEPETIILSGEIAWDDSSSEAGARPEAVQVALFGDGIHVSTITVSDKTEWIFSFEGLSKYADGKEVQYTISQPDIIGYQTTINGFHILNEVKPSEISTEPETEPIIQTQAASIQTGNKSPIIILIVVAVIAILILFAVCWFFSGIRR
ncbi:MAG: Cna B-type domain-containing protein [Blautia sp.]|nr:Cna B-type domain-containing protein [Blautia sp.]